MPFGELYETIPRGCAIIRAAGVAFTQVTRGLASVVTRTGAGIYVVTLAAATPTANARHILTTHGAGVSQTANVVDTSDTVKTINTFAAGVAADIDFDYEVSQVV